MNNPTYDLPENDVERLSKIQTGRLALLRIDALMVEVSRLKAEVSRLKAEVSRLKTVKAPDRRFERDLKALMIQHGLATAAPVCGNGKDQRDNPIPLAPPSLYCPDCGRLPPTGAICPMDGCCPTCLSSQ